MKVGRKNKNEKENKTKQKQKELTIQKACSLVETQSGCWNHPVDFPLHNYCSPLILSLPIYFFFLFLIDNLATFSHTHTHKICFHMDVFYRRLADKVGSKPNDRLLTKILGCSTGDTAQRK